MSGGAIAGIVIGILFAIGIIGAIVNYSLKKNAHDPLQRKESTFDDDEDNN